MIPTLVNCGAIVGGTLIGLNLGKFFEEKITKQQATKAALITSIALNAFSHFYFFADAIAAPLAAKSILVILGTAAATQTLATFGVLAIAALISKFWPKTSTQTV